MRAAAVLLGLVLLTAGCLGMGGDDPEDEAGPSSDGSAPGTNASTGSDASGANHSHEPAPEPHWDNRTGEVDSRRPLIADGTNASEEFTLPDTAIKLIVNLTAESGEIDGEIYPPDCSEEGGSPGEDCSHDLNTYNGSQAPQMADGGSASWTTQDPEGGNWTIRLYNENTQGDSIPYELTIYFVDEHEPAGDHHQ